jgi:hypothetical protein
MPMMFFYFLKTIFDISTSKRSKRYKPHSILAKKKKIEIRQKERSLSFSECFLFLLSVNVLLATVPSYYSWQ